MMHNASMEVHAFRLKPQQDLKQALVTYVTEHTIYAGFILTCVGSLRRAAIRLADHEGTTFFEGKFEIVSLVGTLEPNGGHIHISISDSTGKTIGGHLMNGSLIYTTAEIVLGSAPNLRFTREPCKDSSYDELVVTKT